MHQLSRKNAAAIMRIAKVVRPFDLDNERARMDGALIAMMELREQSESNITLAEIGAVMQKLFHVRWPANQIPAQVNRAKNRIERPALSEDIKAIARRGVVTNGTH